MNDLLEKGVLEENLCSTEGRQKYRINKSYCPMGILIYRNGIPILKHNGIFGMNILYHVPIIGVAILAMILLVSFAIDFALLEQALVF